jgi:hypothetical protein
VLALAAAAAYQLRSGATAAGGLVTFAPMLIALACGLRAARLVLPATAAGGMSWLRRGRLAAGLAALHLARRPTTHRLLTLVAIAVALLGQAVCGLDTAQQAAEARAHLEVGAERVLVVQAGSAGALMSAVHAADPDGRWAMAVVRHRVGQQTIVAVESDRLAAVADWPSGRYAPPVTDVAGELRPATNPSVLVTGTQLLLDASGSLMPVTARLVRADGTAFDAPFTGLRAETPGCTAGCRLAWFEFATSPDGMLLHGLRQTNPDRMLVDPAGFASAGRWRPGFNTGPGAVTLLYGPDWLSVHYPPPRPPAQPSPVRVLVADAPVPLPVVAAGPSFPQLGEVEGGLSNDIGLPSFEVVATANGLPGVGGDGFLVDYEYVDRLGGVLPKPATRGEVWLGRGTPQSIVDRLRARLPVVGVETPAQRTAALFARGSGRATQLTLLAALAGLVLAAIAVAVVAAIEREPRLAELRALRVQGLPASVAVASGRLGYAWFVLGGVLVGALATVASWPAARAVLPAFVDGWTATAVPAWPRPLVAVVVFAGTTAVLLGVALLTARPVARALATPERRPVPDRPAGEPDLAVARRGTR